MTLEKYTEKRNEYIRKQEYYRKKLADLDLKYFMELNKDNKFLKSLTEEETEHYAKLAEYYNKKAKETQDARELSSSVRNSD